MATAAVSHDLVSDARGPPSSLLLWAVALAGCAAAASVAALTYSTSEGRAPHVEAGIVGWITLAYVLCGLVAWWRRPESRFGPLLVAASFGPVLSRLSEVDVALLSAIGDVCLLLPPVLFVHVFLAYPSGRLERRFDRRLLLSAYATSLGFGSIVAVSSSLGRAGLGDVALAGQRFGTAAFVLAALTVLVVRMRPGNRSPGRSRRLLTACFMVALIGVVVGIVMTALGVPGIEAMRLAAFGLIGVAPALLLVGHLRARLARAAVGDMFVELRSDPAPAELRDAISRALRDPSVELVYWLAEFGTYADLEGREVALPEPGDGRAVTVIERDGAGVAALLHDPALNDEPELLDAVTAAAGIAVENGRLHAELWARLDELRGSRARIFAAGQKERQRLERNLHDGAQQRLVALSLELRLLEDGLEGNPEARRRLDRARQEISTSLDELRDVARGIHPAVVSAHGLEIALEQLAARAPIPVRLTVNVAGRLPESLEVAAFYLVSESLANVGKHARATSASVNVARTGPQVVVEIVDDGIGGADTERGSGLRGLADRVEALEGRLRVWSPRGGGTRLRAEIPCAP